MKTVKTEDITDRFKRRELKSKAKELSSPKTDEQVRALIETLNSFKAYIEDSHKMNVAMIDALKTIVLRTEKIPEKPEKMDLNQWDKINLTIKRDDLGDMEKVVMEKVQ